MPEGAPLPKVEATRSYGADVAFQKRPGGRLPHGRCVTREGAWQRFIHPFDHPDIIAGTGALGLEIVEQCPQVRTIAVPVGGGGLIAGIAVGARGKTPAVRVVGVQAEAAAAYPAGRSCDAARRACHARRQRSRRGSRTRGPAPSASRDGGASAGGDPWPGSLRRGDRPPSRGRILPCVQLRCQLSNVARALWAAPRGGSR